MTSKTSVLKRMRNTHQLGLVLALGLLLPQAHAQNNSASPLKALVEIKAECQRVAKLHVEKIGGFQSSRTLRRMAAARAEVNLYMTQLGGAGSTGLKPETVAQLRARANSLLALTETSTNPDSIAPVLRDADACTVASDQLIAELKDSAGSTRAVVLAAKVLYLGQRSMRNYLLLNTDIKAAGVNAAALANERQELESALKALAELPSTPRMRSALELTQQQWTLLSANLVRKANSKENVEQAISASERMFDAADELFEEVMKASAAFR